MSEVLSIILLGVTLLFGGMFLFTMIAIVLSYMGE